MSLKDVGLFRLSGWKVITGRDKTLGGQPRLPIRTLSILPLPVESERKGENGEKNKLSSGDRSVCNFGVGAIGAGRFWPLRPADSAGSYKTPSVEGQVEGNYRIDR